MGKLSGPIRFQGKLSDISAYTMKGCEGTVLRRGWGPSKKDIKTKDQYDLLRRNNSEFGGRSTTAAFIKKLLGPLKGVLDYNLGPVLTGLLKPVQAEDKESDWGNRNVLISRAPFLLEGLNLNRRNNFESVISSPVQIEVYKGTGTVRVSFPQLMPAVNFFPPANFSLCRIKAVLGLLPDFYYARPKYKPLQDCSPWQPVTASSEWFAASKGCPSSEFNLSLSCTLPKEGFSLMAAVGVEVGTPSPGEINLLRHNGCGKIAVVK